jgi:hypothetical protein
MATVEVRLDASIDDDFVLRSVNIDGYNAMVNVLPSYETLDDTEDMYAQTVFNPNGLSVGTNLELAEVANNEFCVYMPEYRNVGEEVTPARISATINDKPYIIEFENYVDGMANGIAYNIVRNHYYQYTITSVNTAENVILANLSYQVMPWQNIDNGVLNFGNGDGDVTK